MPTRTVTAALPHTTCSLLASHLPPAKPARSNIEAIPVYPSYLFSSPSGSTGYASTTRAPRSRA